MFKTLGDYKKEDKEDPSKKSNNYYAGGQKSGIALQTPDDVKKLIEKAKGSVPDASDSTASSITVTLYSKGFTVDDGPFRPFSEPQNKAFMDQLNSGRVPKQLKKGAVDLNVNLVNKSSEDYSAPPPPSYVAFSGSGAALAQQPKSKGTKVGKKSLDVNESQPLVDLQIRLPDGKVVPLRVNLTTKTQALTEYAQGLTGTSNTFLVSGFPPKSIQSLGQTVEQADLAGSTLLCKSK